MTRQLDMFSNPGDTSVGTGLGDLDDDRHGVTSSAVPQVDDEEATSCSAEAPQPSAFLEPSEMAMECALGSDVDVAPLASLRVSRSVPLSPYDVNRPEYTGGETFDDLVRFVRGVDKLRKHGFVTADVETIERDDGWYMRPKMRKDMEVKL